MGRHSSGRQWPFVRSIIGWSLPWLLIAGVVAVGVWMIVDYTNRPETGPTAAREEEPTPEETISFEPEPKEEESITPIEETPEPKKEKERSPDRDSKLIVEGVTVQVLNGTKAPEAGDEMAARLGELGFQIVAVETTSKNYRDTTVFWSFPEAERAAKRLAARFGWAVDEKPGNLADTVSLHVVVGKDEL
ncbi:MAG TPA: LytR C-terminal domain-containing protein [Actinomycetota bacterium]|nr:LytR C-terminal domain-containing protein [Actinomycetota bacterium]